MKQLTPLQVETMEYLKAQIDEARAQHIDLKKTKKRDLYRAKEILDAQNGIVYTQGGNCKSRTLRALEQRGLIEIMLDNSDIWTGRGAFPSKVRVLDY